MADRTRLWRSLYVGFLVLLVSAAVIVIRSFLAIKNEKQLARSLLDYKDIQAFDPAREGGYLLPSLDTVMLGERLDHPVRIITNSKGFRNSSEFAYTVPSRRFRILLLGDSYVDGMRTDQRHTVGYLLEQLLNSEACNDQTDGYEVMISAHGNPADAWYGFQEFGKRYHPQLVILGVTLGNDLTWNSFQKAEPDFGVGTPYTFRPATDARGNRVLVLSTGGDRRPWAPTWFPEEAYLPVPQGAFAQVLGKLADRPLQRIESRFRRLAHDYFPRWTGYIVPAATDPTRNEKREVDTRDFNTSLGLFYTPTLADIEADYTGFFEVVRGLANAVDDQAEEFALVLFPTRLQVSNREWQRFHRYYFLDQSKFDLTLPNRRIRDFCQGDSLPCLDLLDSFRRHYEGGESHLYRAHGDMHFNENGQALAARELATFVRQRFERQGLRSRACPVR